ncbi:unnamed protein product [Trifolium pratense]|uniref:Uncharacterized protein n=1 Tax=Trifolium pratense TaxID=57577 RepID=A0ACB0K4G4_TRIPR|nr:unnamed protein product [Trifolium pratense]
MLVILKPYCTDILIVMYCTDIFLQLMVRLHLFPFVGSFQASLEACVMEAHFLPPIVCAMNLESSQKLLVSIPAFHRNISKHSKKKLQESLGSTSTTANSCHS